MNLFGYAEGSPSTWTDVNGLGPVNRSNLPRCKPTQEMIDCLSTLFEPFVNEFPEVGIMVDPDFLSYHGDAKATTRPGWIYVQSCESFFDDPYTMLEEYYHVVVQWAQGMSMFGYAMGYVFSGFDYYRNPYEIEAKFFATEYGEWFESCANIRCDEYIPRFESTYLNSYY